MKMPQVQQNYYPFGGGLDLTTPAIVMPPGKVIDSQNFEPAINGGYRRPEGYERYDGQMSPTVAHYSILPVTFAGVPIVAGQDVASTIITGLATVLAVYPTYLVIFGEFSTIDFPLNDVLTNVTTGGGAIGMVSGVTTVDGSSTPSDHADNLLLAANQQRTFILAVPGSGIIRGVWNYKDDWYAFRDNLGATAGIMWKASVTGWTQVTMKFELPFTTAIAQIFDGDTVTGNTSGATATVVVSVLRTGTWTVAGAGSLIITPLAGTFSPGEVIRVSGANKATVTAAATQITRLPGGRLEFCNFNFSGSTNTQKMYGADGVNPAFEFFAGTYVPIRTGMVADTPKHLICHKDYLFLSFLGSAQFSSLGNPYYWSVVLGAGEIACSSPIAGFLPQAGTNDGSSLAIFTEDSTAVLYGTSNLDWKLVSSIYDLGYLPYTLQQVSNNAYGMTARGIQTLVTTLNYGDFNYSSVSHQIQPIITSKRGLECASNTLKERNQYRVYYTDGTAIAVGITGDRISGMMVLNYTIPVRCITTAVLSTGLEVTCFGSDDGYVYMDNIGTSQDGDAIEAWLRLPFNNDKSPRIRKRFRRANFEMQAEGFAQLNVTYDLGYGSQAVMPGAAQPDTILNGAGGYWDQVTWDQFTWDAQLIGNPSVSIEGTEKNISFLFYTNRSQDQPFTLQGLTLISSPRILDRS